MKYFSDILKQFKPKAKFAVLILLLVFSSTTFVLTSYFKTDDCRPLVIENLELQRDLIEISQMIREMRDGEIVEESAQMIVIDEENSEALPQAAIEYQRPPINLTSKILQVSTRHLKRAN